MEDVARRVGVSRVTVYRYHADKTALLQAVIVREVMRASLEIERRLAALSIEQNPVVEGFTLAVRLARHHPLLQGLLTSEPEWLLVHMTRKAEPMMMGARASASAFLRQERFKRLARPAESRHRRRGARPAPAVGRHLARGHADVGR
ncbi:MAG: helix-turn-helix transcriptional regulator [Polyangiaceae bacterium]|nr:helix-turn-helix transcriptional regulator [Polyangiaceae bacterium]